MVARLLLCLLLFTSCATQSRCLKKFPPEVRQQDSISIKDSIVFRDSIIELEEISFRTVLVDSCPDMPAQTFTSGEASVTVSRKDGQLHVEAELKPKPRKIRIPERFREVLKTSNRTQVFHVKPSVWEQIKLIAPFFILAFLLGLATGFYLRRR